MAKVTQVTKDTGVLSTEVKQEDNWLKQVNETIANFKELVQVAKSAQGQVQQQPGESGVKQSEIATILQILIKFGYGDKPIGQLLQQISPFTIKQVLEVMQNAIRPKE